MRYSTQAITSLAFVLTCAVLASLSSGGDARGPLLAPDFLDFGGASDEPYVINGDRLTHDRVSATAVAEGHAIVSRGSEVLRAGRVRVTMTNRMAYAEGGVSVTKGTDVLTCDRLRMDLSNNVAYAEGNVVLMRGKDKSTGTTMTYDFANRKASVDAFEGSSPPFKVWALNAEQRGTNVVVLRDAVLSTCTNHKDHLHFYIKARTLTVTQGESLKISGATWYLGPVPVFYLPGWYRNLNSRFGFRVKPGYASRWGGYLLTSCLVEPTPWLDAETHIDYRTRRGFAGGQDLRWRSGDGSSVGFLSGYYANDLDPVDAEDDPVAEDLDSERFRLHLVHEWKFTTRDKVMLSLDCLSDTDVVEDFFGRQSRRERLPENHIAMVHRGDGFSAGLRYSRRLNDFYSTVDRMPEATLTLFRMPIASSGLYYEADSSASWLEQTMAAHLEADPYSSGRADVKNRISYPMVPFRGVSLVPRVGYRFTYYSDTPDGTGEGGAAGGGVLRRIPEYGMSASMRIFKVWPEETRPLRHIVEPYADYTRLLAPSELPENLYQFDEIDALDATNVVRVGVRNTLQTKRDGDPWTLADVNLYTVVNLDPEGDGAAVDMCTLECELTPNDPLRLDIDVDYSRVGGAVESVDARLSYDAKGRWLLTTGYLSRRDRYRLLNVDAGVRFGKGWRAIAFGRYEFDEGQMQEEGVSLRRAMDCMTFDLDVSLIPSYVLDDGTLRPDEWSVSFALVFTAFPDLGLKTGRAGDK